jgi:hypothetical protein
MLKLIQYDEDLIEKLNKKSVIQPKVDY